MRWGAALFLLLLPMLAAHAHARKSDAWARSQFDTAERMREALNGRPAAERTRHQYQQVIDAYRRVYFGSPTSSKADPSVLAVAELMVEMGRRFDDDNILRSAIAQYQFLRREYPGSKYRVDALFTIGEIYKDDLDDSTKARATFQEFLKRYPHSHLADDARGALEEPVQRAALTTKREEPPEKKTVVSKDTASDDDQAADDDGDQASTAKDTFRQSSGQASDHEGNAKGIARVTGIRHWSTPDYTRVAIDLEQGVKFESQRISHPDRIFFDLPNTRLASTLVGKTFDVDDGFLRKIRVAQFAPGKTRVVLEVDELSDYEVFLLPNPSRLIIDIHGKDTRGVHKAKGRAEESQTANNAEPKFETTKPSSNSLVVKSEPEKKQEKALGKIEEAHIQEEKKAPKGEERDIAAVSASTSAVKKRIVEADDGDDSTTVANLDPPETKPAPATAAPPAPRRKSAAKGKSKTVAPDMDIREAQPTADGDRSLIRALGLKIGKIVIDPGHGGHDTGTIGPNGLEEKDLVLDVAKRLGKQLERLGAQVVYTRTDDTFIPLETRTAIANQEQADLFVSIHANSSHDPEARGVETYYLNFTSSSDALEVAARENAVSEKSIHELQDLVKKIALKEKIEESHEFATDVQQALYGGLSARNSSIRDRGVKKAPFIVLIGANMPSILAEISFVSNPDDERKLETPEYRQKIAESLYRGISKYVKGLSGVKVASKIGE